jgi:hypothetical protein
VDVLTAKYDYRKLNLSHQELIDLFSAPDRAAEETALFVVVLSNTYKTACSALVGVKDAEYTWRMSWKNKLKA